MTAEEMFFRLNKIHRTVIVVALAALILVLFYFFVVSDMLVRIDGLQKQIGRIKIAIINEEKILKQGPALKKRIVKLKHELQSMVASLPQKQEIEELLKKITDLLSENNLVAKRFVPGKEHINRELYYATIPISLSVQGDYQKHGAFLASLKDLPRIVNVPKITLKKGGMRGREGELAKKLDVIPLDAQISGVTYRRLSPEEIKRITAQAKARKKGKRRRRR
ncbi:MAG: type 4a pilus biogenesis protein PilO [Deltaproteobacteria bacterium]